MYIISLVNSTVHWRYVYYGLNENHEISIHNIFSFLFYMSCTIFYVEIKVSLWLLPYASNLWNLNLSIGVLDSRALTVTEKIKWHHNHIARPLGYVTALISQLFFVLRLYTALFVLTHWLTSPSPSCHRRRRSALDDCVWLLLYKLHRQKQMR